VVNLDGQRFDARIDCFDIEGFVWGAVSVARMLEGRIRSFGLIRDIKSNIGLSVAIRRKRSGQPS
jgi:hypothetical protein